MEKTKEKDVDSLTFMQTVIMSFVGGMEHGEQTLPTNDLFVYLPAQILPDLVVAMERQGFTPAQVFGTSYLVPFPSTAEAAHRSSLVERPGNCQTPLCSSADSASDATGSAERSPRFALPVPVGLAEPLEADGIPLDEIGMPAKTTGSMKLHLYNDGKAAISISTMEGLLRRVKRMELRAHYVKYLHRRRPTSERSVREGEYAHRACFLHEYAHRACFLHAHRACFLHFRPLAIGKVTRELGIVPIEV